MGEGFFNVPIAKNEPIQSYAPGTPERQAVLEAYETMYNSQIYIPLYINGKYVTTTRTQTITPPHEHQHIVGQYYLAEEEHIEDAISSALEARKVWSRTPWEHRAGIFLKAAELIAGPYRAKINAATMLGQSKNIIQCEADAACQLIDFLRFNAQFMTDIYTQQPESTNAAWNRMEYRPLEGFTYAVTPFNFTSIATNLPTCMALMGNVVIWKPSDNQVYSAKIVIDVLEKAGLPPGVINVVFGDPEMITKTVLSNHHFSGLHFTGSTSVFKELWKQIGNNITHYKTYPRIVGETGGKGFVLAHHSAAPKEVTTALSRGAFEFQGQKCSAASRAYIPKSIWNDVKQQLLNDVKSFKMGAPNDMGNFINAVIHERAFDKLAKYIDNSKTDKEVEIIAGGTYDKSKGYFVAPTVMVTRNPKYVTMCKELFGPIVTIYVYEDNAYAETLQLIDETSDYALTGAIFATDRYAIAEATEALRDNVGNLYINDKCTGAVIGHQPFGGARASGTNDKAGSMQNLLRWVSPRLIKEVFIPPTDYRYPFLAE
ncbi:L-glutamate gamma-semialdehyde dehydrogenase [Flavobacteriaceae bacterium GSB9]|nr:L-glutamate gamma-semialdehyde dehydrogenase [Flavobacteriaceae bacterium GSB9]